MSELTSNPPWLVCFLYLLLSREVACGCRSLVEWCYDDMFIELEVSKVVQKRRS